MTDSNFITIDGTITSRIIFIIFIIILFALLYGFSTFQTSLISKQSKEVDKYMAGVVANRLLHSPDDYKKASYKKSGYLLYKRTLIPFTFLILTLIIFLSYMGGAFGFRIDNVTSIDEINSMTEPSCHWGIYSLFGFEPIFMDTGWGFSFLAGVKGCLPFNWVEFYVLFTNITSFIALLMIFVQLQGFVVRFFYTRHVAETNWSFRAEGMPNN